MLSAKTQVIVVMAIPTLAPKEVFRLVMLSAKMQVTLAKGASALVP
jgi:hypothetical protein